MADICLEFPPVVWELFSQATQVRRYTNRKEQNANDLRAETLRPRAIPLRKLKSERIRFLIDTH
jgi:hypothetical protein